MINKKFGKRDSRKTVHRGLIRTPLEFTVENEEGGKSLNSLISEAILIVKKKYGITCGEVFLHKIEIYFEEHAYPERECASFRCKGFRKFTPVKWNQKYCPDCEKAMKEKRG